MDCLFCTIIDKKLNTKFLHEDEEIVAFEDIHPKAPVHTLIVSKKHISTINNITDEDTHLVGRMIQTAKNIAAVKNIAESGYRLMFNCNADGGQEVYHIHLHLLGGKKLKL